MRITTQNEHPIDVFGASVRGADNPETQDRFAIASLTKTARLHSNNLEQTEAPRLEGPEQGHLVLLADGLERANAPAEASSLAAESAFRFVLDDMPWMHLASGNPSDVTLALEDTLQHVQEELLHVPASGDHAPAAKLAIALIVWPNLYLASVGGSHVHLQRQGELRRLAPDADRERNETAMVGGSSAAVRAEIAHVHLRPGDDLALLTANAKPEDFETLAALLRRPGPAEAICRYLLEERRADDRTAIVLRFARDVAGPVGARRTVPAPQLGARGERPPTRSRIGSDLVSPRGAERDRRRIAAVAL